MNISQLVSPLVQCSYRNESYGFQVVRVEDSVRWIERTLAAGQLFQFESRRDQYLNVYMAEMTTLLLCDRISCETLAI